MSPEAEWKEELPLAPLEPPLDQQIRTVSWFLFQEGSVLPEIVTRLTYVYGKQNIDIVAVTVYLQDLKPPPAKSSLDSDGEASFKLQSEGDEDFSDDEDDKPVEEAGYDETPEFENENQFKSRRKVSCPHCNKVHVNKYTLDTHIRNNHKEASNMCKFCGKMYGLIELLKKHIRVKHNPRNQDAQGQPGQLTWKCRLCSKVFKAKRSLEIHFSSHTDDGGVKCDLCGKILKNSVTLAKHRQTLHSQFACYICNQECLSRIDLKRHLAIHGFLCKTCSKVFDSQELLEEHTRAHSKATYPCQECDKVLSTEANLKQHRKRLHGDQKTALHKAPQPQSNPTLKADTSCSKFVCETCGKSYSSSSTLQNHILYDHLQKEKPFQCHICSKGFSCKTDFNRHVERHSSQPAHTCKECGKLFGTKQDMLRHVKVVHEKIHAGSCEVCGRKFQNVGGKEWRQHMNSHSGIKDISCPLCNKTFCTDESLKCHLISHYDTMYWSCGVCSKDFKRLKNVKYHLKAAHGLADMQEIKQHCVKLRKAPTKADIQELATEALKLPNIIGQQSRTANKEDDDTLSKDVKHNYLLGDLESTEIGANPSQR